MKSYFSLPFSLFILLSASALILLDENAKKGEKEISTVEDKNLVSLIEITTDEVQSKHNPYFRSKYYRKKNSLLDTTPYHDTYRIEGDYPYIRHRIKTTYPYKGYRQLQNSYPTSRAYHPPITEKDYLRQERSDRRVHNRKIFLRQREMQLKRDYPELFEEIDSRD